MGFWGYSLYANDVTCDVRDSYYQYLQTVSNDEEAYSQVIDQFRDCLEGDEAPLVWYALADSMWKYGRLTKKVKEKALMLISEKSGVDLFEESQKGQKNWEKTLNKLEEKLIKTQPKRKAIRVIEVYKEGPWNIGDIYAYQLHSPVANKLGIYGEYLMFRKIGVVEGENRESVIEFYKGRYKNLPDMENIAMLPIMPLDQYTGFVSAERSWGEEYPVFIKESLQCRVILPDSRYYYPKKHLFFLGNTPTDKKEFAKKEVFDLIFSKVNDAGLAEISASWDGRYCFPDGRELPLPELSHER